MAFSLTSLLMPHARSLGAKLLAVTLVSVMAIETLLLVQSIALEQRRFLMRDVDKAHLVMLALTETPMEAPNIILRDKLLSGLEAESISADFPGIMTMVLQRRDLAAGLNDEEPRILYPADGVWFHDIPSALATLWGLGQRSEIAVIAPAPLDDDVQVTIRKSGRGLVRHLRQYASNILGLSLLISAFTGLLVYAALYTLIVRPIRQLAEQMQRFAQAPERFSQVLSQQRGDEIGVVQKSFDLMRDTVQSAFRQKSRLATLGTAVTKINHDLKNVLSTALLMGDSLASSSDPMVAKIAPRLVASIEKATSVCTDTLDFTRDAALSLQPEPIRLRELALEVGNALGAEPDVARADGGLVFVYDGPDDASLVSDRLSMFRILSNLGHNAVQAGARSLHLGVTVAEETVILRLGDDGPGLPQRVQEHLFEPFISVGKKGGTGLGLAIVRDLTELLGGEVRLAETSEKGTCFQLELPREWTY